MMQVHEKSGDCGPASEIFLAKNFQENDSNLRTKVQEPSNWKSLGKCLSKALLKIGYEGGLDE